VLRAQAELAAARLLLTATTALLAASDAASAVSRFFFAFAVDARELAGRLVASASGRL